MSQDFLPPSESESDLEEDEEEALKGEQGL